VVAALRDCNLFLWILNESEQDMTRWHCSVEASAYSVTMCTCCMDLQMTLWFIHAGLTMAGIVIYSAISNRTGRVNRHRPFRATLCHAVSRQCCTHLTQLRISCLSNCKLPAIGTYYTECFLWPSRHQLIGIKELKETQTGGCSVLNF
jgi:hypothetical protein